MSVAQPQRGQTTPLLLVGVMLASLLIGAAAVSVARADDGAGLSVEVIDSSASATPTSTSTPTSTATFSTTVGGVSTTDTSGGGAEAGTTTTQPGTTMTTSGTGDSGVAGVIYVSGLSWSYAPSLNPLDGTLNLRFAVRNVYRETLSPSATFWINQIFGGPVDESVTVPVANLKAGETRIVEANFHGLAQWTMLSAHATLAVPSKGEVMLAPIVRDAIIWFLPWFIVLLVAIGGVVILWRRLRQPPAATSAAASVPGPETTVMAGPDEAAATEAEVP